MFDPSQVTLAQVSSTVRDFTIVFALVGAAWKARGLYESGARFFARCNQHMDVMEQRTELLLTNHLHHIEADLATLAGRKTEKKSE